MLNKKKINLSKKPILCQNDSTFFQYPKLSNEGFVQTGSSRQLVLGINSVFNQYQKTTKLNKNNNRFKFNSKQFREFFIFNRQAKKFFNNSEKTNIKNFFFFLNCVFTQRRKVPFYLLKRIKGGYIISVLGVLCFVPRSLFKISLKQQLISFKLYKKTRKFSRSSLKLNLVSSLIQKKN
jgi:ribosomal protein S1